MVRNEGERLRKVVVCAPGREYFNVKDPQVHNIDEPANRTRAVKQHDRLCMVMREHGVEVIPIAELAGHPNSVFTRDTCICAPGGFIQLRMGLRSRQGEEAWMASVLKDLNVRRLGVVHDPGTVEGGDIVLAGNVVFIGRSRRSNDQGIEQVKVMLGGAGYDVRVADVPPSRLHIGGMMSMIGPCRILHCEGLFPDDFFAGFDTVTVPDEHFVSGNVICMSDGVVIAEQGNTTAITCLEDADVRVHAIDLSEFVKGRGGPTCLILPVERQGIE